MVAPAEVQTVKRPVGRPKKYPTREEFRAHENMRHREYYRKNRERIIQRQLKYVEEYKAEHGETPLQRRTRIKKAVAEQDDKPRRQNKSKRATQTTKVEVSTQTDDC